MSNDGVSKASRFLARLSILMYCVAFIVPHFGIDGNSEETWFWGAMMFLYGMIYCWLIPLTFSWWANVLFWISLRFPNQPRKARNWSFFAGILALSFVFVVRNDPGAFREMISGLPYMLWTGSMFLYSMANHLRVEPAPFDDAEHRLDDL